jgi:hypothetical protein
MAALLTLAARQSDEREAAQEAWVGDEHVFTMEDGRALDPQYVSRLFQKIRRQGEPPLPEQTFHDLRHCHASLLLAGGADISIVSKLLGHSSIAVTADIYVYMMKVIGQQAVDGAAALIAHIVHTQQGVNGECVLVFPLAAGNLTALEPLFLGQESATPPTLSGGLVSAWSANRSVAATSASTMPGSEKAWPATGTIANSASGQALCKSYAVTAGVATS